MQDPADSPLLGAFGPEWVKFARGGIAGSRSAKSSVCTDGLDGQLCQVLGLQLQNWRHAEARKSRFRFAAVFACSVRSGCNFAERLPTRF